MDTSRFEVEISLRYAAMRDLIEDTGLITVLHIGTDQTGIAVGNGFDPQSPLALAIGSHRTAREHFKHSPPIMSAIDFSMDIVRQPAPKSDRVNVLLSGKFLPYKAY